MRLGKDLQNKPIYSITDGRHLGNVKDIYLTSTLDQINGVYLGSEGLIKRKHFLIKTEDVLVFGIDAILVKENDVVTTENELPESVAWVRLSKLRGRQIDTTGGTKVASVGDIILDDHGRITGFALSRVYLEGPVAEKGSIPRPAMVDTGDEDGVMTIDLTLAENPQPAKTEPSAPLAPAPDESTPEETAPEPAAAEPESSDPAPAPVEADPFAVDEFVEETPTTSADTEEDENKPE